MWRGGGRGRGGGGVVVVGWGVWGGLDVDILALALLRGSDLLLLKFGGIYSFGIELDSFWRFSYFGGFLGCFRMILR